MKKLPLILIAGGLVIGGIAWFGNKVANTPSDEERIRDALLDQRTAAEEKQQALAELRTKVVETPASCEGETTAVFFNLCELEPDPGTEAPDWAIGVGANTQRCVLDAFHSTNEHNYALSEETYTRDIPSDGRVIAFACDVASASMFTDGVSWGDTDTPAAMLLEGFHQKRAEQKFSLPRRY